MNNCVKEKFIVTEEAREVPQSHYDYGVKVLILTASSTVEEKKPEVESNKYVSPFGLVSMDSKFYSSFIPRKVIFG